MTSTVLKEIFNAARPVVEQWLDTSELFKGFQKTATAKGLDWGQIKSLLKAQVEDERDGGKRVERIINKADNASAYADMLGLSKMNEKKYFAETVPPDGDSRDKLATRLRSEQTAEMAMRAASLGLTTPEAAAETVAIAQAINNKWGDGKNVTPDGFDIGDIPHVLNRRTKADAVTA